MRNRFRPWFVRHLTDPYKDGPMLADMIRDVRSRWGMPVDLNAPYYMEHDPKNRAFMRIVFEHSR